MLRSGLYRPLNPHKKETRLLRLYPSHEFDESIKCDVFIASLDDESCPTYQALSYAWGDQRKTSHISMGGIDGPMKCGLNLSLALRHIRHETNVSVLWVDAICINQSDAKEREHQVQMMGLVYNKAQKVIAWLGDEARSDRLALELVNILASCPSIFNHLRLEPYRVIQTVFKTAPIIFNIDANLALLALSTRTYWSRAWIFQELALARQADVKCGKIVIAWDCLENAVLVLRMFMLLIDITDTKTISHHIGSVRDCWQKLEQRSMLSLIRSVTNWRMALPFQLQALPQSMFEQFVNRRATDPRDLVFSLFGFLDPSSPHADLIRPAYWKSTEEVYQDLAQYLIRTTRTLCTLNSTAISASVQGHTSLPSWVPDWRTQSRYFPPGRRHNVQPCEYTTLIVDFLSNGRVLSVKGFEIDKVITICHNTFLVTFFNKSAQTKGNWQDFVNHILEGPTINGETSLSAFIRLWNMNNGEISRKPDRTQSIHTKDSIPLLRFLFDAMNSRETPGTSLKTLFYLVTRFLGDATTVEETQKMMDSILNGCVESANSTMGICDYKHTIFRTDTGLIGLGPEWVAREDRLCQLGAHSLPFLLRPVKEKYRNVGQCIVLDLEQLEMAESLISRMKVFDIE